VRHDIIITIFFKCSVQGFIAGTTEFSNSYYENSF